MKKKLFVVIAAVLMLALTVSAASAENTVKTRDTVLVLDATGSMYGTPMAEMKEAAKIFCSNVLSASGKNRVAIVVYQSSVTKTLDFTSDQDSLNSTIDSISASWNTNIGAGIDSASSMLSSSNADVKNIVLLTDGLPNTGSYRSPGKYSSSDISRDYYIYANYVYERCSELKQNYNIYTLGFFHNSSEKELDFGRRFLMDIQNKGYYEVTNASDLKFVFDDLAEDITEENYPIIIVPGIMGSELYDSKGDVVWIDPTLSSLPWWKAIMVNNLDLGRLDIGTDLKTPKNGINLNAPGSKREYGAMDTYQKLVDSLCEQFPNRAIYFFSYDWRQSNYNSADELNSLINEVKTQTGYSKVDLVCHSMGGLVASSYVNKYGTTDARCIITLATPYEGSPDIIYRTLTERGLGTTTLKNSVASGILSRNGLTKEIMADLPSSPQLAPTERYFKSTNFLKRGEVKYNTGAIPGDITSELLTEDITYEEYCNIMTSMFGKKKYDLALAFQESSKDALLNLDNTYFAVGTGEKTVDSVVVNKGTSLDELKTIELTYNKGDGTVPYESATMTGLLPSKYKGIKDPAGNSRYREFKASHTGILSHDGALLWVKNILSQTSNPYEESDEINYSGYTVIRIACPIDVTINVNGEILSSDPESGSTYVSNGRLDFIGDDGVSICLDDIGTAYDINIVGTGEGTMDYNISWYDADNTLTETRSFEAVPITKDTVIKTTSDSTKPIILNVDSDGDGVIDTQWSASASGKTIVDDLDQGTSSISLSPENLTIDGKAGEKITKNITVSTSQASKPVAITPTSLQSENGNIIDTSNIKVNPTTVNVSSGVPENILVTINIPESAISGNYTGKINATSTNSSDSCNVHLRVTDDNVIDTVDDNVTNTVGDDVANTVGNDVTDTSGDDVTDIVNPINNSVCLYPANPTTGCIIFANHSKSSTEGGWINLSGGKEIQLPQPLKFTYCGTDKLKISEATIELKSLSGQKNKCQENNTKLELTYPYSTHPFYTERQCVTIDYNGPSAFKKQKVTIYLVKGLDVCSASEAFGDVMDNESKSLEEVFNEGTNSYTKVCATLDENGDLVEPLTFGCLEPGSYGVLITLADHQNNKKKCGTEKKVLSATCFEVVNYELETNASDTLDEGDNLDVEMCLEDAPTDREFTYGALLINKEAYKAEINVSSNGTRAGTDVFVNDIDLRDLGVNFTNYKSKLSKSELTNEIQTLIGEGNGTISIGEKNQYTLSLTTFDLLPGDYLLFTGVYEKGKGIVGIDQKELTIF